LRRLEVAIGIGIMIVIVIPLGIKIVRGIDDVSSHLPQCVPPAPSHSRFMIPPMPCRDFTGDLKLILIYAGVFCVGLWLFIFGIKEISLRSFSK